MRQKRGVILLGMAAGLAWAVLALVLGARIHVPIGLIQPVLMGAALGPGLVLIAMIGRLAQRRFFDDALIDGQPLAPGGGAEIDQRVLQNTLEQTVLALCLWPFVGFVLGVGTVAVLAAGFTLARVLFWTGYHLSPPLRAFGFAATFYPQVVAALWTLWVLGT